MHFILVLTYLSSNSLTEVVLKQVLLKILQNSQENTYTRVSFLIALNNFINEETLAQCFPKPLVISAKSSIVDVWLG